MLSSTAVNNGNGWKTWDVTPLVQQWVDAISPNYGIALLREAGSGAPNNNYNSRESAAAQKPQLVVTYQ